MAFFRNNYLLRLVATFEIAQSYQAVYNWLQYLKNKGHFISGYLIMPNHLHALIAFSNPGENINKIIGNGKRWLNIMEVLAIDLSKKR